MNDFTTGKVSRQILFFALPMLIGNIFQQVYSMVDAIMVGRFVSGNALAAVGASSSVLMFLLSALIGLTSGASVVISQFFGAKQIDSLKRTVSTSVLFLGGLSVVVSLVGFFGSPLFLRMLNVHPDFFQDAVDYLQIMMAGMVFPIFYNMYTAYLRALGDSRNPLYFLIISTMINTCLDYIFIVNIGLGVKGAAYATIIAQAVSAILCFLYANFFMPLLQVNKILFDTALFRLILKFGVPAAVQLSITSLASLTIMRLVNSFGPNSVAGYTAATKIDAFAIMPVNNISIAASTFVGQNMGAGLEDRAKQGLRSTMLMMVSLAVFMSILIIITGPMLVSFFVDGAETEIIQIGVDYLSIMAAFYVFFAVFFAFNGFFRGAGDAVIVMILTITSLTIRTISAHVLVHFFHMGPEAVAVSIPIGWGLCGAFAFFYYKKRLWAGKVATTPEAAARAEALASE